MVQLKQIETATSSGIQEKVTRDIAVNPRWIVTIRPKGKDVTEVCLSGGDSSPIHVSGDFGTVLNQINTALMEHAVRS